MKKNNRGLTTVGLGASLLCLIVVLTQSVHLPTLPNPGDDLNPQITVATDTTSTGRVVADDDRNVAFNTSNIGNLIFNDVAVNNSPVLPVPNLIIQKRAKIDFANQTTGVVIAGTVYPLRAYQALLSPNDPNASQWWTTSTNLPAAWDVSTGGSDVTIAIIDTGFALNHEEFANRWHRNSGETGATTAEQPSRLNCTDRGIAMDESCNLVDDNLDGIVDNELGGTSYQNPSKQNCTALGRSIAKDCNNIDDDKNGYVDDVTGWDFMNQDASVQAGQLNPAGSGTTHGTMVAGVAAATGNNGRGIAGVNWNAKILPIQALDDDGYGDTVSVGDAIYYAVSQQAQVISISLGTPFHDPYVRQAIYAATAAGITVIAASGNDGCDCLSYPARYPEVLAVGAINRTGAVASFSSYGSELDIVAPGVDIRTTTWASSNPNSAYASGVAGTSFATPYVAGLIAAMISQRPSSTPLQLIGAITESVSRPSGSVAPLDPKYGFGSAQALGSLQRMATAKSGLLVYRFSPVNSGSFVLPGQRLEKAGNYSAHSCETTSGTTPLYQLVKGDIIFYSISRVEVQKAIEQGYVVSRFAYVCIQQDHDAYTLVRLIDIFKEFRNDYSIRQ